VILRWNLQKEVVTIPKSIKEHRIVENAQVFDFELSREDIERIDGLNKNDRIGSDPDEMSVGFTD
jgi:methylglyoxal/glyoxal reductase